MILIIFTVNTSEFALFKSRECHKGRNYCLCLLTPGGFCIEQSVTKCVGEHGLCNVCIYF